MNTYKYLNKVINFSSQSKYLNWYTSFISRAALRYTHDTSITIISNSRRAKKLLGYVEGHHVVPKSICPKHSNSHYNIVYLTRKEHYIAHLLLTKMLVNPLFQNKMIFAFRRMTPNANITIPPVNLGKILINNGNQNVFHLASQPIPTGWNKGASKSWKEHRTALNQKNCKTILVFNIITNESYQINKVGPWASEHNIPVSTIRSAIKNNNIIRKTYKLKYLLSDTQ